MSHVIPSDLSDDELSLFRGLAGALPRVAILMAQVDPDAIGSAIGLAEILRAFGCESSVYYAGAFGHPQTLMLWEAFGLGGRVWPVACMDPSVPVALVDSSKAADARLGPRTFDPVIVLDHHGQERDIRPGRFRYVNPVGAASSLVAVLAERLGVELGPDARTLLAIGIHTDTDGLTFVGTRGIDRHAFAWLMDNGDQTLVYKVSRFALSERACSIVQRMLTHRAMYRGNVLISHPPGVLEPHEGDYIGLAADILVRHEGARLVLALGVVGDRVRVSARTRDPALPLAGVLSQLFGPNSGARECSGGALLELPQGLRVGERREDKFREFLSRLEGRIAELDIPA